MFFKIFTDKSSKRKNEFDIKLNEAIELIRNNQSIVAERVLEVLESNLVTVNSFFNISHSYYQQIQEDLLQEEKITIPSDYPPSDETVKIIEGKYSGIIYDDQHIYLSSDRTVEEIASTLVHEICHYLNSEIFRQEQKNSSSLLYRYKDEVRSFTAEKIFERNGHCILRSHMRNIHAHVTRVYPEFVDPDMDMQKVGYVYSCYDTPIK
ncbi:hypothetical protein [Legionella rowbothamii]|uniref:hypothetical protein n=1 Tax=Legionella rowbothamii TaxID=96229 RepID=UPI0010568540|nr:hypothetical protein [Legionella rowbothamii]